MKSFTVSVSDVDEGFSFGAGPLQLSKKAMVQNSKTFSRLYFKFLKGFKN